MNARTLVLLLGLLPLLACADELPDAIPADFPFPAGADPRVTTMDVAGATQYVAAFSYRGDAGALYEEIRQYAGSHGYSMGVESESERRFSATRDAGDGLGASVSDMGRSPLR